MQRIFLSEEEFNNHIINNQNDLNHLKNVLRIKKGESLEAVYSNKLYLIEVLGVFEFISFDIKEELNYKKQDYSITLIQGVAKGDKNDDIIMHSVELGVNHIILSNMKYSVSIIKNDKLNTKVERFNKISLAASKQCHRIDLVDVNVLDLNKIDYSLYDIKLLLDEEEAKKENPRFLNDLSIKQDSNIIFLVGPEGGISNEERDYLINQGFIPISLGKNILRTETASLSFLAQLEYKLRGGK